MQVTGAARGSGQAPLNLQRNKFQHRNRGALSTNSSNELSRRPPTNNNIESLNAEITIADISKYLAIALLTYGALPAFFLLNETKGSSSYEI